MGTFTYANLKNLAFDRCGINAATDAPVSDTEFARFVNDAYADLWNISGGRLKKVASATAWTTAQTATGIVTGILTDIEKVVDVFASTTSGSTGFSSGDYPLEQVEYSYIQHLRGAQGYGTYGTPKVFSIQGLATATPASVDLKQLDYWPSVTGYYLPTHYVPQFTEIDSVTVTTPDLNDLESRDLGLLTAMRIAPLVGRAELVPSIAADISERTARALDRKFKALLDASQDDAGKATA